MDSLEKKAKVKEVLSRMCGYGDECPDCVFFDPEDTTDGEFWCAIRDSENLIPFDDEWDVESAMMAPPIHYTDDYKDYFFCPNCQKDYYSCGLDDGLKYKQRYCDKCGCAIDWSHWKL